MQPSQFNVIKNIKKLLCSTCFWYITQSFAHVKVYENFLWLFLIAVKETQRNMSYLNFLLFFYDLIEFSSFLMCYDITKSKFDEMLSETLKFYELN